MFPCLAVSCLRMRTRSPLSIPAFIIDSPRARSRKNSPSPVIAFGKRRCSISESITSSSAPQGIEFNFLTLFASVRPSAPQSSSSLIRTSQPFSLTKARASPAFVKATMLASGKICSMLRFVPFSITEWSSTQTIPASCRYRKCADAPFCTARAVGCNADTSDTPSHAPRGAFQTNRYRECPSAKYESICPYEEFFLAFFTVIIHPSVLTFHSF